MISRVILMGIFGVMGLRNLYPIDPEPIVLTPVQLRERAKQKSVSEVCRRNKKQSKTVKDLCKRWEKHNG
jgi:hypothetical protein